MKENEAKTKRKQMKQKTIIKILMTKCFSPLSKTTSVIYAAGEIKIEETNLSQVGFQRCLKC